MHLAKQTSERSNIYNTNTYKTKRPQRGRTIQKNSAATCATAELIIFSIIDIVQGRALDLLRRRQEPTSSKELILHTKHYFTAPYKHKCSVSANFISTKCSLSANFILQKCSASANFYKFYTTSPRSLLSDEFSINIRPR